MTTALRLLRTLPDTPERAERELDLHLAVGSAQTTTHGWGADEVEEAYTRALDLCDQAGDQPKLFPALRGLWEVHELQAKLESMRDLAERLLALAERADDPDLLMQAHHALGETTWLHGEFARARGHLEQGLSFYDPARHRDLAFQHGGYDVRVACESFLAWALWFLGYPDQAVNAARDALAWAREIAHPFSVAFAHGVGAWLHQYRREPNPTREHAERLMAIGDERGFSLWCAWGSTLHGWALAMTGQCEQGIAEIRSGLAAAKATGAAAFASHFQAMLAEAHAANGQIEEALAAVEQGLVHVDQTGEVWWEAELQRLRGELLRQRSPSSGDESEACFRRAIDIASRQEAKSLELRATTSLARLLDKQGTRDEARRMLAEIYGWFTEGFDTADLKDAKALLDALS